MPEQLEPDEFDDTDPGGGDIPGTGGGIGTGGGGGSGGGGGGGGEGGIPTVPGVGGSTIITPGTFVGYIPGNLGSRAVSYNTRQNSGKALRTAASANVLRRWNNRYRGTPEAFKFNLQLQGLLFVIADLFLLLNPKNTTIKQNLQDIYPSDTEIIEIRHSLEQIRYKEYLLQRSTAFRWYN